MTKAETPIAEHDSTAAETYDFLAAFRDERIDMVRKAVRVCGVKWLGDYFKLREDVADKRLSAYTDAELTALYAAASRDARPAEPDDGEAYEPFQPSPEQIAADNAEMAARQAAEARAYDEAAGRSLPELRDRWHSHKREANRQEITDLESAVATACEEGIGRRMAEMPAAELADLVAKLDVFFACYAGERQADDLVSSLEADTKRHRR